MCRRRGAGDSEERGPSTEAFGARIRNAPAADEVQ